MGQHKRKGVLTSKGIENLIKLKKFRNTVMHEYLPLLKDNEKDFPKWYHEDYLSGVINLNSCKSSLGKIEPNALLFHAIIGLNKLLEVNQYSNFKYSKCGLLSCKIKGSGSSQSLQIKFNKKDVSKWQSVIDSLDDNDIFSWTKCNKIEVISD